MSLYELPKFELPKLKAPKFCQKKGLWTIVLIVFVSATFGFLGGAGSAVWMYFQNKDYLFKIPGIEKIIEKEKEYVPQTSQEQAVVNVFNNASPAVVSIIVSKDMPVFEEYYYNPFKDLDPFFQFQIPQYIQKGTEKKEIGGGTGFIISTDGTVLTNKHVVLEEGAEYTVLTNDGQRFSAKLLAKDPFQDIAVLKIIDANRNFPTVKLGNSDRLQIGQTVITIGNVLGELRNSISVGVVSGLGRTITASGSGGFAETLEDVIQTDAAINKGNSGGPLLNLKGEVIGINTAMSLEGQNVGFAIPINKAKKDIDQVIKTGKIAYPYLGIRYVLIDEEYKKEYNLPVDYGLWILKGSQGEVAVYPNSPAAKAGIKEKDIILEFNGEKITVDNPLSKIIMKYNPGDKVSLKALRDGKEMNIELVLGERTE